MELKHSSFAFENQEVASNGSSNKQWIKQPKEYKREEPPITG